MTNRRTFYDKRLNQSVQWSWRILSYFLLIDYRPDNQPAQPASWLIGKHRQIDRQTLTVGLKTSIRQRRLLEN